MNAPVDPKHLSPLGQERLRMNPRDREFLPAALEILETPPSPVRMAMILTICGCAVAAIAWSFIGRVDIVAIAQGKIQSAGRVKLVQPLETGKVRASRVQNGDHVNAGDVVVELEDGEARAEIGGLVVALAASRAEALRRAAAIAAAKSPAFAPPAIAWPDDIPANVRAREERVLAGDLAQLSAALASLAAQRGQKAAEQARLAQTIASQQLQLAIGGERVDLRQALEREKLGSKLNRLDAQENLQQERTTLAQQKGQLAEAIAASLVMERDAAKTVETFIAENSQKLADAERQAEESAQRLAKARAHGGNMILRAPVAGVIQGLTVTSVGQVVMAGEELMRVVPDSGGFEIECYLPNKDIGFVAVGQEAVVKIDSFPFTRYGALTAKVSRVGADAIPEPDAAQRESDPAKSTRSSFIGGAERTQNLYFPITLTPEGGTAGDGASLPISNGMSVTVEIKTGDRRIIDYIFSPVVEVGSRALKER